MKAFSFPCIREARWIADALPGVSPAALPVAGRLFVDYALEAAERFGVEESVLVDKAGDPALNGRLGLERDGLCAVSSMRLANWEPESLERLMDSVWFRGVATSGEPCIVLWGQALPFYKPGETGYEPVPEQALRDTPTGVYHLVGGRWQRPVAGTAAIRDTASWLDVSMHLLAGAGGYTLPGYSAENGVHLCRNVVMEHGTTAKSPVLMLDNSWCGRDVVLEGGVILGRNASVGRGARLRRTVVCDDTYVGEWLELDGKIVAGGRIIDAASGVWVDVEERGIARKVPRGGVPKWLNAAFRLLAGRSFSHGVP